MDPRAIGPDASEKHFGSSGGIREGIWGRPGESGRRLGGPGGVRGGPGGVLGGSWALLGRSWSDLGGSPISDRFFDRFWAPKGCPKGGIWGAKMEPKSILKSCKIEVDFQHRKKSLQDRLRTVSEPSWGDLGPS